MEFFPANSQTPLSRNKIKMKSENISTGIEIFEYNLSLLHLPWILRQKKSNFRNNLSPMKHFRYIQRNRLWTMVDFILIYSFRGSLEKQYCGILVRGSLLFLALFAGFLHTNPGLQHEKIKIHCSVKFLKMLRNV